MASNVTRDHHNLRRNLKLNDNYISNDGGNEGITVVDSGSTVVSVVDTSSILLDGTDDYIDLDDILDTHFAGADKKFTLSAWIKPSNISGVRNIVSKFLTTGNHRQFQFYAEGGILKLALSEDGSDDTPAIYSVDAAHILTIDEWYHVGVTVNLEADTYIIYKGGEDIGSYTAGVAGNSMTLSNTDAYLSFDGDIGDKVTIPRDTSLEPTTAITVSVWVWGRW